MIGRKLEMQVNDCLFSDTMTGSEYNELRIAVGWRPITNKQADRGIEHTTFIVAVRDKDKIVGMGRALFDFGYTAYIGDVIVKPDYQGKGIGKSIVETLIYKVKESSDPDDRIMFILGAAKGKEGFYEKLGFIKRPNENSGCGMFMWIKNN